MSTRYNREDYKTVLPQLEKKLDKIDKQEYLNKTGILDLFYPIGSYYETSNVEFDPNKNWGGTWELETEGLVHIGSGATYSIGSTGGEREHTLTVDEMPSHNHKYGYRDDRTASGTARWVVQNATEYNTFNTTSAGNDQPHNNMQPYLVVNRWHRIK